MTLSHGTDMLSGSTETLATRINQISVNPSACLPPAPVRSVQFVDVIRRGPWYTVVLCRCSNYYVCLPACLPVCLSVCKYVSMYVFLHAFSVHECSREPGPQIL